MAGSSPAMTMGFRWATGVIADALPSMRSGSATVHFDAFKICPSLTVAQGKGGRRQGRRSFRYPECQLIVCVNRIPPRRGKFERKGKAHENACCIFVCYLPQPCGGLRVAGNAAGPARPGGVERHHPRRRRLRRRLAPRSLWRLPPDVQLPARLAFRAVRPPLLQELVNLQRQGPRSWSLPRSCK
jgi:hypothetical protein